MMLNKNIYNLIFWLIVLHNAVNVSAESIIKYNYIDYHDSELFKTSLEKVIKEDMTFGTDRYYTLKGHTTPKMVKITIDSRDLQNFRPNPDDIGYTLFKDRTIIVRDMETLHSLGMSCIDSITRTIAFEDNMTNQGNPKDWILVFKDGKIVMEWFCGKPIAHCDSTRLVPQEAAINVDEGADWEAVQQLYPMYISPIVKDSYSLSEVDECPSFPGGNEMLQQWIADNFTYPEAAKKQGLTGYMHIILFITEDGTAVLRENAREMVKPCFRDEIDRLVSIMPKWTPAKVNGVPVSVTFFLNWRYP